MLRMAVFDQRSEIGNTIECSLHVHLAPGSEPSLGVAGEKHIGSAIERGFNFGIDFVFLHGCAGSISGPAVGIGVELIPHIRARKCKRRTAVRAIVGQTGIPPCRGHPQVERNREDGMTDSDVIG